MKCNLCNQHRINEIEVKEFLNSRKVGRVPTGDYEGGFYVLIVTIN